MANYHLHASLVKRSAGRSATAAAAYRSATEVRDERTGETHDYSRKQGVVHSEILLPEEAPERFYDRSELWNAAELAEKRKDAQLAREFEGSLPRELDREDHILIAREFARGLVEQGMCVDVSIHDRGDGNPHFHALATTRSVDEDGFGKKNREWNDRELLERERERFAEIQNRALERSGHEERVDHRSYEERGVEREPMMHEGPAVREIEQREMTRCEREGREYEPVTAVARENADIRERNDAIERIRERIERLSEMAREFAREMAERLERIREREEERYRGVKLTPVERFDRVFSRLDEIASEAREAWDRAFDARSYNESMPHKMEANRLDNLVDRAVDRMADEYSRLDLDEARSVRDRTRGQVWEETRGYVFSVRETDRRDSLSMAMADARDACRAMSEERDHDHDHYDRSDDYWDRGR